ncbi:hypothetical protein Acsp06_41470 [Actinomycetospora sp. NBRC 106375]|nr:hypothetical protein [Actinomycetospora sp. NBRC 106375]GLZ47962.1 hypothetical protein Acsp06_41470 [Actinomycetospora sp. NBRC 106375]
MSDTTGRHGAADELTIARLRLDALAARVERIVYDAAGRAAGLLVPGKG